MDQFQYWKIPFDEESLVVRTNEFFETEIPHLFVIGSAGFGRKTNSVFIENGREHAKIAVQYIVKSIQV